MNERDPNQPHDEANGQDEADFGADFSDDMTVSSQDELPAEDWQQEAPVDDFAVSPEQPMESGDFQESVPQETAPKKSMLPVLAGGLVALAVLGVGGYMGYQYFFPAEKPRIDFSQLKPPPSEPAAPVEAVSPDATLDPTLMPEPKVAAATAENTLPENTTMEMPPEVVTPPPVLEQAEPVLPPPAAAEVTAAPTSPAPELSALPAPTTAATVADLANVAASTAPTTPVNEAAASAPSPTILPTPTTATTVVEPSAETTTAPVAAQDQQISDLKNQITDLQTQLAAAKTAAEAVSADKQKLTELEQRLTQTVETKLADTTIDVVKTETSKPKKKAKVKKAVKAKSTPTPQRVVNTVVLRAAMPGQAWIAPDPRSSQLEQVQIGDSVPGLGQVKAIRQVDGRWQVEGTNGILR